MARSLGGVTAFVLDLSCGCSGIEPVCEGVCHWQSFVHQTNTAPFAGQSDTCGAGRAQLNPSVMPGRATVFFSQSSITIHVFYWNPTQQKLKYFRQKCWSCNNLFRSRGRPKALYAVRLGVRGAKWCAGQLGGRARVQRGGDLSRHLPPRRPLHAAAAITKKVKIISKYTRRFRKELPVPVVVIFRRSICRHLPAPARAPACRRGRGRA